MSLIELSRKGRSFRTVQKYRAPGALLALISMLAVANAQPPKLPPGLQPYTPTRIDWLVTTLQASLRDDQMQTNNFMLQITSPDPETILIYVRYLPNVDRAVMNLEIDSARQVIQITAKRYGWHKWLRIREDVQLAKLDSEQ